VEEISTGAATVMIVDDVEVNRFVLSGIIEDMGLNPVLAENGKEALGLIKQNRPNVILLDVSMPEMDGYELCKILKKDMLYKDIPIIFISAYDSPEDVVKGFEVGSEDYITKPFIPEEVKARVGVHLKVYTATRNLMEMNRKLQISVKTQLNQMEQEKKGVLYGLANVARKNACYEEDHMERLRYNSKILAQAMQLSPQYERMISDTYVSTIEMAAPLCDIGNLTIPMEILQKTQGLTPEEREKMQRHTTQGAQLLMDVVNSNDYNDFIQMAIDIASYHHENWDGSGYPNNKAGNEIPVSAQIVAIAGAYCALTEDRTYRKAYTQDEAMAILKEDVGTKYNEDIYDIMVKIIRQFR